MTSALSSASWILGAFLLLVSSRSTFPNEPYLVDVGLGWAKNSINTVKFRKGALASLGEFQAIGYYDGQGRVVLGTRHQPSSYWSVTRTPFRGRAANAHNSISVMLDGSGYLHLAWDTYRSAIHYSRSLRPFSSEMAPETSIDVGEARSASYPEFYRFSNGNLLFCYREGVSGNGTLAMNSYDASRQRWSRVQLNLLDGEGRRNAYWQMTVDKLDNVHLSWVWRESDGVSSNHDLCYAVSRDRGASWFRSDGKRYTLPITADSAEYAARIPENSTLINQTSMDADDQGYPIIASYWADSGDVPQYHIVYHRGHGWKTESLAFRRGNFSLSGTGTKRIPISRPEVVVWPAQGQTAVALLFRDSERGDRISAAVCSGLGTGQWKIRDLLPGYWGAWEPNIDWQLWRQEQLLSLFVERTEQVDGEGLAPLGDQIVSVLEVRTEQLLEGR